MYVNEDTLTIITDNGYSVQDQEDSVTHDELQSVIDAQNEANTARQEQESEQFISSQEAQAEQDATQNQYSEDLQTLVIDIREELELANEQTLVTWILQGAIIGFLIIITLLIRLRK